MGAHANIVDKTYALAVAGMQDEWFIHNRSAWYSYVQELPTNERVTYLVVILHSQVMNGGFDQYFSNVYGLLFSKMAHNAYCEITSFGKAYFIEQAISLLESNDVLVGVGPDGEIQEIRGLISVLQQSIVSKKMGIIDDSYYDNDEDVFSLLKSYLLNANQV